MSYLKPDGLLLSKPVKRKTKKSPFLRKLEQQQKDAADAAHVDEMLAKSIDKAKAEGKELQNDNRNRRVASLSVAYARRRDK